KLRLFVARPGWHPEDLGGFQAAPEVDRATARKFTTVVPPVLHAYVFLQFAAVLVLGIFVLREPSWSTAVRAASGGFIVATLVVCAALLEGRRWSFALEGARVLVAAVALSAWLGRSALGVAAAAATLAAATAIVVWLVRFARAPARPP